MSSDGPDGSVDVVDVADDWNVMRDDGGATTTGDDVDADETLEGRSDELLRALVVIDERVVGASTPFVSPLAVVCVGCGGGPVSVRCLKYEDSTAAVSVFILSSTRIDFMRIGKGKKLASRERQ